LKAFLFAFILLFACSLSHAFDRDFGGKIGVTVQFGTHIHRFGVMYQLYYYQDFVQFSQGTSVHYNFKSLGPQMPSWELHTLGGVQFYGGVNTNCPHYILTEYSLMANKSLAGGYLFRYYWDTIGTTQATGGINFTSNKFSVIMENDLFSFYKGNHDKYRTGTLGMAYAVDSMQIAANVIIWTGNTRESKRVKGTSFPSHYGYKDLTDATYGKYSHGIAALRVDGLWNYKQTYRFESGIDAEQIRNLFQNKLVHDLIHKGEHSKHSGNPHVPMLQKDGMPFLYQEGQQVRPAKLYFQSALNDFMFY